MKIEDQKPFVVVLHSSEANSYGHPWYELVKSVRADCDYLDIDQHSDKSLLEHIKKTIPDARPFILLVDVAAGNETPAGMSMLIDSMLRQREHCYAFVKGEHELIKKWLTPLGDHLMYNQEVESGLSRILNQDLEGFGRVKQD